MRWIQEIAVAVVLLVGFPLVVSAQPQITALEGELSQGAVLTITGASFGNKTQPQPLRWDDFEDGVSSPCTSPPCDPGFDGSSFIDQDMLNLYDGIFDVMDHQCRQPYYSDGRQRYEGDMCLAQDFWSMPNGCGSNRAIAVIDEPSDVWYVSFWTYRDDYAGTAMNSDNQKIHGNFHETGWASAEGQPNDFRWDEHWYPGETGRMSGIDCRGYPEGEIHNTWGTFTNTLGRWVRVERFLELGDPGVANGYHAGYIDLEPRAEVDNEVFVPLECEGHTVASFILGNYFRPTNGALMVQYISELYVDHSFARVEVGDAENWNACTHREIQYPTEWSNGSITITGNLGSFETGETVYIFVVDQDNRPSAGVPVVVGQGNEPGDLEGPGEPGMVDMTMNPS